MNEFQIRAKNHPKPDCRSKVRNWDRFDSRPDCTTFTSIPGIRVSRPIVSLPVHFLCRSTRSKKDPVSVNFRLRYTYRPDSDLFIVYNLGSQFTALPLEIRFWHASPALRSKLTYSSSDEELAHDYRCSHHPLSFCSCRCCFRSGPDERCNRSLLILRACSSHHGSPSEEESDMQFRTRRSTRP